MALPKPRVVVGLDFGTTHSGFAFADITDPDKLFTFYDYPRAGESEKPYCKTITGSYYKNLEGAWQFKSWGYPARAEYARDIQAVRRQRASGPSDDPFQPTVGAYLTRFKLHLACKDMGASSAQGLPAGLTVNVLITDYLREMGTLILEELRNYYGAQLTKQAIQWCVTVPSIWDNAGKAMMKTCMTAAGLVNGVDGSPHPLIMVLEPEAASFFCHKSMSEQVLRVGDKLLVADIGGGTADIVVQEVVSVGKSSYRVKEVTTSSGGLCGGTYVDARFIEFLHKTIGPCLQECITQQLNIYSLLVQAWEHTKTSFGDRSSIGESTDINLPHKVATEWEKYDRRMGKPARYSYDDLEISYEEMQSIFDPVIEQNMQLISRQLAQVGAVKVLVVVGGFAESPYLMECIRKRFAGTVPQIMRPPNPGSAVCQGAVMLALNPDAVVSRVCKKTVCLRSCEVCGMGLGGDQIEPSSAAAESNVDLNLGLLIEPKSSYLREYSMDLNNFPVMCMESKKTSEALVMTDIPEGNIESEDILLCMDNVSQSLFQEDETIMFCDYDEKNEVHVCYFKDHKDMARIVGVGFEYGKVTFGEGDQVYAIEISKNDWELARKSTGAYWTKLKVTLCQSQSSAVKDSQGFSFLHCVGRPVLWDIAKFLSTKRTTTTSTPQDVVEYGNTSKNGSSSTQSSSQGASTPLSGNGDESSSLNNEGTGGEEEQNGSGNNRDERDQRKGKDHVNGFGDDPNGGLDKKKRTTVLVDLLPSSGKLFPDIVELNDVAKNEHELENVLIKPRLDFEFSVDNNGTKNIQAIVESEFLLDVDMDTLCTNTYDFGWFHDEFLVSFGVEHKHTKFISNSKKLLDVTRREIQMKEQHTLQEQNGLENEVKGRAKGGVSGIVEVMGVFGAKSIKSTGETILHEKNDIGYCQVTQGGFIVDYAPKGRFPEKLQYKYEKPRNPRFDIKKIKDADHRKDLKDSPMCKVQIVKFQGIWEPRDVKGVDDKINSPTYVEYILETLRDLRKIVRVPKQIGDNYFSAGMKWLRIGSEAPSKKEKLFEFKEKEVQQKYVKTLCLNHAMSHLSSGHFRFEEVTNGSDDEVTHLMELIGNTLESPSEGALVSFPEANLSRC